MATDFAQRRAALLLHSLQSQDRDWMLSQMDPDEREALQKLLLELGELGIPRDQSLLDQTVAGLTLQDTASPLADKDDTTSLLENASAASMARLLKDEAPQMVARLLACKKWSWSSALLIELGPLKRRQIESFVHTVVQPAPHFSNALVKVAAQRLQLLKQQPEPVTTIKSTIKPASSIGSGGLFSLARWRKPRHLRNQDCA